MRVSSNTTSASVFTAMPKNTECNIVVTKCESKMSSGQSGFKNPMLEFTHEVEGGDYDKREIRYDTVMTGGQTKNGPMNVSRYAQYISAFEVPWTCFVCHPEAVSEGEHYDGRFDRVARFHQGTGDDGVNKGEMVCPDCHQKGGFDCDSSKFIGARATAIVSPKKGTNDDREFDSIVRVMPRTN